MTTPTTAPSTRREPDLVGQTVVVIGASAGIGLETARRARGEGAEVILTGRNPITAPCCTAMDSTPGTISCARPSPSGVSSVRPTSRPSPCTS